MLTNARKLCCGVIIGIASSLLASDSPKIENAAALKVAAEIQRLQKLAAEQKGDRPEWKDLEPAVKRLLTRADEGVRTGRLYAAVDDLGKARVYLEAYAEAGVSAEAAKMPAFEEAWKKASVELVAMDKSAQQRTWTG